MANQQSDNFAQEGMKSVQQKKKVDATSFKSRRQFIKRSTIAAVPAVMTLHSGRAIALLSFTTCYNRIDPTIAVTDMDGNPLYYEIMTDGEGRVTDWTELGTDSGSGGVLVAPSCYNSIQSEIGPPNIGGGT